MEWRETAAALEQLSAIPHNVTFIKLKSIWDLDVCALSQLMVPEAGLPLMELVDCLDGQDGRCHSPGTRRQSESGSNYSDNDSFGLEESEDPTDSDMSDGDDEGPDMGAYATG
ncbi:hypothetical protein FRC10_011097 [Ceratobasidium sp. 414]|nr:hypothetical protein FRC10_011097 [Ceratobasidium sp. 414]